MGRALNGAFFDYDRPSNTWLEFEAEGFSRPVTGVIYRTATPVRGMILGGVGTGHMHLGPDDLLDRGTAFNSFLPPGASAASGVSREDIPSYDQPLLGLAVGEDVWILALPGGGPDTGFEAVIDQTTLEGHAAIARTARYAQDIHCWGHYPVMDVEYETSAPVRVGSRVWVPFLPGDAEASNTPGMVIQVSVRNTSNAVQKGSVIVNFPGFSEQESVLGCRGAQMGLRGSAPYPHHELEGDVNGVFVHHEQEDIDNHIGYALGVIGEAPSRIGRDLGDNPAAWAMAASDLPAFQPFEPGTSMAVDFALKSGETRTVRFVLGWYAPFWQGRHGALPSRVPGTNPYTHKYYDRFKSEVDVAKYLAREHETLLKRVLAWQEALYASEEIPSWLRDSLINICHIIGQNSFWAVSRVPGHWAGEEGLFCMNETLPTCAQQGVIACDFIAQYPLLFMFPDLVRQGIRGYTARQRPNGEIPFIMGCGIEMDDPCYNTQYSTDSQVYVYLVARQWQRTGDREVLDEFYPAVKKAIGFLQSVDDDGDGLVDVWGGSWFYEGFPLRGASVFVGGLWLCTLRLAVLMAEEMGDDAFAHECRSWIERGSATLEEVLWDEETSAYLLYHQPATGARSDVIIADQLVGEWATHFHGVEHVFPDERVARALDTVWRINAAGCEFGVRATMHPNRVPYQGGYIPAYSTLTPSMLGLYRGDGERWLDPPRNLWQHMTCRKGWTWDQPSHVRANGERMLGHDYYHNTMLWALPAAVLRQDLATFCAPGGLVDRILTAE